MANEKRDEEEMNEEKVLFEWEAEERHFQKKNRDFWVTAVAILILVSVIFIFIKEFFLVVALFSVLFLYYVLSTVPPGRIKNKLTNWGIYFGELKYSWGDLERFWFTQKLSSTLVEFETKLKFPRQVSLVVNESDKEKIKAIVLKKIPLIESNPSYVDKITKWFNERLPLENKKNG